VEDILPYFHKLYQKDKDFQLAISAKLSLELEEVAYLLDGKIDSPAVKHVMQGIEGMRRNPYEEETARIDTSKPKKGRKKTKEEPEEKKLDEPKVKKEVPKEEPKEEKKEAPKSEEQKGTQTTLF
jgi:outer membrane biosynthesis protein TonB